MSEKIYICAHYIYTAPYWQRVKVDPETSHQAALVHKSQTQRFTTDHSSVYDSLCSKTLTGTTVMSRPERLRSHGVRVTIAQPIGK